MERGFDNRFPIAEKAQLKAWAKVYVPEDDRAPVGTILH